MDCKNILINTLPEKIPFNNIFFHSADNNKFIKVFTQAVLQQ